MKRYVLFAIYLVGLSIIAIVNSQLNDVIAFMGEGIRVAPPGSMFRFFLGLAVLMAWVEFFPRLTGVDVKIF